MADTPAAEPSDFLPLTPAMFHLLLSLVDGDKHGYSIMKEVGLRSEGRVRMSAGTLYGLVKKLLDQGLIAESADRPTGGRRRTYTLTPLGRAVVREEARRMEQALLMARGKGVLPT